MPKMSKPSQTLFNDLEVYFLRYPKTNLYSLLLHPLISWSFGIATASQFYYIKHDSIYKLLKCINIVAVVARHTISCSDHVKPCPSKAVAS